jgi:hypothetical protein
VIKLVCSVSGHKVSRSRVWHDQLNFRSKCKRCGSEMIRTVDGWRVYDPLSDGSVDRLEGPQRQPAE